MYEDKKGEFFNDLGEVLDEAFAVAHELEGDAASPHRAVIVTDEKGKEIARLVIGNPSGVAECEAEYLGYKIKAERTANSWLLQVTATRPDLPIVGQHDSRIPAASGQEALAVARRWIDSLQKS